MFSDDDLIPISALQHYAYCPRQCALIHIERQWTENRFTAEGRVLHERAHSAEGELRDCLWVARHVDLVSHRLGLRGQADVVEFYPLEGGSGIALPGRSGRWLPQPVEYKRGRAKPDRRDEVQLCAQAICLEEMLGATIELGMLFYGEPRRRTAVRLTSDLRATTELVAASVHALILSGRTPPPVNDKRCRDCSLLELCLPAPVSRRSAAAWFESQMRRQE